MIKHASIRNITPEAKNNDPKSPKIIFDITVKQFILTSNGYNMEKT